MIVFIDTEVSVHSQKVTDIGAIREDGAILHTHSILEFNEFIGGCSVICGHNIIRHDLKYLTMSDKEGILHLDRYTVIDTLCLSPLLFPKKPYHRLLKDDKLQSEEINNPVNDAQKARDLFYDEIAAWNLLSPQRQTLFYSLLRSAEEFSGFFRHLGINAHCTDLQTLIRSEYQGRICANANIAAVASHYPHELAYSLAVIGADDLQSLTPAWVMRNYPKVANVMNLLRNTPCGQCDYCRQSLDAHRGLKEFFGYEEFRIFDGVPMQQQAVEAAIRGESLLTIFPTGGGKSLTFQLPALMAGRNIHGLTVVISPLQSLMKDQVDNLNERGISDAVTINGLLDPIERASALAQVADGTANLLYIAPEMLRSKTIERLLMGRTIARFVIDEAHCFSAWGHDFRVDYLYIGDFIRQLQERKQQRSPITVSCFTATAKQKVISDICDYFKQKLNLDLKVFAANSARKNLRYSVIHADTPDQKYNLLRNLILEHRCPTIVYVSRTKRTHLLAGRLRADGFAALPFNGKMDPAVKVQNQNSFMSGETQVIVATSAFGMGVDKKDVGLVVHFDISDSLENYIQEAGRAGRDPNMEAACYVLFNDDDLDKHFILLNQTKLSISEIQQVWKALKALTPTRPQISCSPLEIARQAGWNDEVTDIETRVKAALAALEEAGYIQRGSNTPHIFATGITVPNMDEARRRLTLSPLFDSTTREEAARIIRSLISARATAENSSEAESRIDYLADILGMTKETVIRNVNLMRQEGLLADTRDMQAWIERSNLAKNLANTLQLEQFLLSLLTTDTATLNYKRLNQEAQSAGIPASTVRRIKTIIYFLALKGYVRKEEHTAHDSLSIHLQTNPELTLRRFNRRAELCRFVVYELTAQHRQAQTQTPQSASDTEAAAQSHLVNFSLVDLLHRFETSHLAFGQDDRPTLADLEECLLYLSKTELLKIEGGFLVIYNTLQLNRLVDRRARYGKEQYRMLDEFYKQRIRQIHIVGEYANLMVRDYDAALQFVSDYFTLDYRKFINKYFKGERSSEISKNITPTKYHQLFGQLSECQLQIINDKQSRYIVVAAGPGSGKTRVLVHKLASLLLLEDVKHEQLLMLTFSRSAATEFKQRLVQLVGHAAHFVDIKTFHSFSFDLVGKEGNLEEAGNIVGLAADMIERGEVEEAKIAKSVLVIDEAQDMASDDFRLVTALARRNEEMRLIAVGDDDQNIYAFRGSDSAHLRSLVTDHQATLYQMTTNYRSASSIVALSNSFATLLADRMKTDPCQPARSEQGTVQLFLHATSDLVIPVVDHLASLTLSGSTCLLTTTNLQALQATYMLNQRGLRAKLIQNLSGFHFSQLAEVRYFLKQLVPDTDSTIPRHIWDQAKLRTLQTYATSSLCELMQTFFADYESTHTALYLSDLTEYLLESNIEDFFHAPSGTITVSTIHKAKGREYDNVFLLAAGLGTSTPQDLRALYVAITRAKNALYVHTDNPVFATVAKVQRVPPAPTAPQPLCIPLGHRDVYLDFFKDKKSLILRLRSGQPLSYRNGYLYTSKGEGVAALSNAMLAQVNALLAKGYSVARAEVSFIVAWSPKDDDQEYAVCLADLFLTFNPR